MKSILIPACLSLLCASAFAVEPAVGPAGACVAPVFPAKSTSVVSAKSVHSSFVQWRSCVAAQPTEENLRADVDVRVKAMAWQRATAMYFNNEAAFARTPHEPVLSALDDRERANREHNLGQQAFLRDRVTNDVAER
jgi:hypothetical protein